MAFVIIRIENDEVVKIEGSDVTVLIRDINGVCNETRMDFPDTGKFIPDLSIVKEDIVDQAEESF